MRKLSGFQEENFSPVPTWWVVYSRLRPSRKSRILTQHQITAIAAYHGRLSYQKMLLHWFLCFFGNLAGALFVMAIILGCESGGNRSGFVSVATLTQDRRWRLRQ